jgi:hypothetical protein
MAPQYATYEAWFEALPDADKERTNILMAQFKAVNAPAARAWVRSEISENLPQLATFLFLHDVWVHIDSVVDEADMWIGDALLPTANPDLPLFTDAGHALRKMKEAGLSQAEIVAVARLAAYNTAWGIVHSLDRERAFQAGEGSPGWRLMETNAAGELTGRDLGGLHESLLSLEEDRVAEGAVEE